jgi:hypothetical protein
MPGDRKRRYFLFIVLPGMFISLAFSPMANAQAEVPDLVVKTSCEHIEPLTTELLEKSGFVLHETKDCSRCFAGETEHLRNPDGKAVSATTAYRRYIDRKNLPHSNPVVWYTERELRTSAKVKFVPSEGACRVSIAFGYTFYGIQMVTLLPVDGDWVHGNSNSRLETEYLIHMKGLSFKTARP